MEIFAAYEAYNDYEIGRVIQAIEDMGKLDNTLIIYINGDNGTSAEGGPLGTPNEVAFFNGVNMMPVDEQMKWYDVWGTEQTYNHMSAGWSWAFDTPFTWFKQNASRLGGIRQCMAISWPGHIKDKGGLREQFMHVIDVVPTILEVAGIPAPEYVDGIKQAPIEGTSFAYTFDAKNAKEPSRHKTQYFEMMGQWALYHEGWLLSTKVNRAPWEAFGAANPDPLNNQVLELYDLNKDFSQSQNLADKYPDKVKELKKMFIEEAKKYQVFPMDASVAARIVAPRPNITAGRTEFVYTRPMVGLPQGDSPMLLNASYTITADITVPEGGAEGMILTSGGRFAGYGFYLLKGKPVFLWNLIDLKRIKWEGPDALAPGKHTVEFDFKYDGLGVGTLAFNNMSGLGRPGTGTLKVDGKEVQTITMEHTLPMILQWDESFDIGSDTLTGVNDADYQPPFTLTAKLNKLTIKVDRPQLSPEDIKKLEAGDSGTTRRASRQHKEMRAALPGAARTRKEKKYEAQSSCISSAVSCSCCDAGCPACHGRAGHRCAGFAQRHHHDQRKTASAARSEVRRGDQGKGLGVEGLVGAARRAAEGRAQRAAHHDGRCGLRRAGHVRRRRSDTGAGSHREERAALHEFPLHVALLADARGD